MYNKPKRDFERGLAADEAAMKYSKNATLFSILSIYLNKFHVDGKESSLLGLAITLPEPQFLRASIFSISILYLAFIMIALLGIYAYRPYNVNLAAMTRFISRIQNKERKKFNPISAKKKVRVYFGSYIAIPNIIFIIVAFIYFYGLYLSFDDFWYVLMLVFGRSQ